MNVNRPKRLRKTIERRTIIAVCIYTYCAIYALALLWVTERLDVSVIEPLGLNLIGDFVAGFFAPLALIGLGAAFFLQREQLRLAQHQHRLSEQRYGQRVLAEKEVARLNYAATQANYRAALYDKRKSAFDRLAKFGSVFTGPVSADQLEELKSAISDARFVFPDEVNDWLYSIVDKAEDIHMLDISIKNAQATLAGNSFHNPTMFNQMVQNTTKVTTLKKELLNSILSEALFSRFKPYMTLPDSIEP